VRRVEPLVQLDLLGPAVREHRAGAGQPRGQHAGAVRRQVAGLAHVQGQRDRARRGAELAGDRFVQGAVPEVRVRAADDDEVVVGQQHRVDAVLRPHHRRLRGAERGGQLRQEDEVLDRERVVGVLDALGQLAGEDVGRDRDAERVQVDLDPGPPLPVGEQRQQQLVLAGDVPAVAGDQQQRAGARVEQDAQARAVDGVVAAAGREPAGPGRRGRRRPAPAGADAPAPTGPGPRRGPAPAAAAGPRPRPARAGSGPPPRLPARRTRAAAAAAGSRPGNPATTALKLTPPNTARVPFDRKMPSQPLRGRQQVRPGRPVIMHAKPTSGEIWTHS